ANGIGEPQVNVFNLVVLHHFRNFSYRHYNSSNSTCAKKITRRCQTTTADTKIFTILLLVEARIMPWR
ncbi:MAG: hypothetical protein WBN81_02215, partial [Gammaproteobacteria bacterium]